MCFCSCFSTPVPKYEQHLLACYPPPPAPAAATATAAPSPPAAPLDEPRNVGDLVYYVQMVPKRLPKVGQLLLRYLLSDLKRGAIVRVRVGLLIFHGLVSAVHAEGQLNLYLQYVITALKQFLCSPHPDILQPAALLFSCVLCFSDEFSDSRSFPHLAKAVVDNVINYNNKNNDTITNDQRDQLRYVGLSALHSFIVHYDATQLVECFAFLAPALAIQMEKRSNIDNDTKPQLLPQTSTQSRIGASFSLSSVPALSSNSSALSSLVSSCFASLCATPFVSQLISALIKQFDHHQWSNIDNDSCLLAVLANARPENADIVCLKLVDKIDANTGKEKKNNNTHKNTEEQKEANVEKKEEEKALIELELTEIHDGRSPLLMSVRVLKTAGKVCRAIAGRPTHWLAIVDRIVEQYAAILNNFTVESAQGVFVASCDFVCAYAARLPSPADALAAVQHLVKKAAHSKPAATQIKRFILELAASIASSVSSFPSPHLASDVFIEQLVANAVRDADEHTRAAAYRIAISLLTPAVADDEKAMGDSVSADSVSVSLADSHSKFATFMKRINDKQNKHTFLASLVLSDASIENVLSLVYYELSTAIPSCSSVVEFHRGRGRSSASLAVLAFQLFALCLYHDRKNWASFLSVAASIMRAVEGGDSQEAAARGRVFFVAVAATAAAIMKQTNKAADKDADKAVDAIDALVKEGQFDVPSSAGVLVSGAVGLVQDTASAHTHANEGLAASVVACFPSLSIESLVPFSPSAFPHLDGRASPHYRECSFSWTREQDKQHNNETSKKASGHGETSESPALEPQTALHEPAPIREQKDAEFDEFLAGLGRSDTANVHTRTTAQQDKKTSEEKENESSGEEKESATGCGDLSPSDSVDSLGAPKAKSATLLDYAYPHVSSFDFYLGAEME